MNKPIPNNQQERLGIENWLVGFTDGEGCFSVSIIRNKTTKSGWQIFPEFVVTQGAKSLGSLEIFQKFFGCGRIFINKRYDNHHENLYRYCVRSVNDLKHTIIPFFKKFKLLSAKQNDFEIFGEIIEMMIRKEHLSNKGKEKIAKKIQLMNRKKKSRFLESSETTRRAPSLASERGVKI